MKKAIIIVAISFNLTACSNQQVYNSVQTNQQNECDKLQTTQREECLKRLTMPYGTYEQEREKLLKDKSK